MRVIVTGGDGFFGSYIVEELKRVGHEPIVISHKNTDLTSYIFTKYKIDSYAKQLENGELQQVDAVIHCAALSGGIVWNQRNSDVIFHDNTLMSLNVLRACQDLGINNFLGIISSCAYPDLDKVLEEEDFWNGLPNESIRFFGLQKRNMLAYCLALRKQYPELNYRCAIVNNLYGPRDTFDLVKTKVVGALIKKIIDAVKENKSSVQCLGTGNPTRQFTYVADAAQGIIKFLDSSTQSTHINITDTKSYTIRDLAEEIAWFVGYKGELIWETDKPDGQLRKDMSGDKARKELGWEASTPLKDGLAATIDYYYGILENNKEF
jgi:GDP-L-fucose synthase